MKERPILFSGAMVRAILECRKTQTRRVINPQPEQYTHRLGHESIRWHDKIDTPLTIAPKCLQRFCPYGAPGDRLWVRETHFRYGHWEAIPGARTKAGRTKWMFVPDSDEVRYADSPPKAFRLGMHHKDPATPAWHKRPSLFMLRRHSRITLEIVGVRVENDEQISNEDAMAEGVMSWAAAHCSRDPRDELQPWAYYQLLWDSINGQGHPWRDRPWRWVVEFKRV